MYKNAITLNKLYSDYGTLVETKICIKTSSVTMDVLIIDLLMYINLYYYLMYSICSSIITLAKYGSIIDTPNIKRDAIAQVIILISELIKLIIFHKLREHKKEVPIIIALLFTLLSISGLYYVFFLQEPVLKLEMILDSILSIMLIGEVFYSLAGLIPFKRTGL
ncbi:hypothetical protein FQR65_LT02406 [Abscondita terminalis]|nr:hypothetical protein FQR65_LT02406 [Abscondita terminalis]